MRKFAILAPLTLTLAGCFNPHVMTDQDAAYCEFHFVRGSDAHAECAAKRDEEREQGGGK